MRLRDLWGRMAPGTRALVLFCVVTLLTAYAMYHPGITSLRWAGDSLLFLLAMVAAVVLANVLQGTFVRARDWYRRLLWRKGFEAGMRLEDSDSGYLGEPSPPHRFCLSCKEQVDDPQGMAIHLRQDHVVVWIARWESNPNPVRDGEAQDAQSRDDDDPMLFTRIVSAIERADPVFADKDRRDEQDLLRDWYATTRLHVEKPHENRQQCPVCFGVIKEWLALLARRQKAELAGDQPTHDGGA